MDGQRADPSFRFATGGPIGEGLAGYGTRTLLIPVRRQQPLRRRLVDSHSLWTFASGAPIDQEPLVADQDIYVVNQAGLPEPPRPVDRRAALDDVDPGRPAGGGQPDQDLSPLVQPRPVHRRSQDRPDVVDPGETHVRAGLNLREYDLEYRQSIQ